tara:strand:+ start:1200 stop:1784 length:585 start_codon:yes stop_codon:yes gene_type:complete
MKIKHPKQKEETDSYEIGDIIESPTRNLFGEIVSFLGDRVKSVEVIVLDKRLKPLVNLDGEFKYKKLRSELVKHFDYSKLRISRGFFLGDVIVKTDLSGNKRYGILVGFTHPDGLETTSYSNGYNGIDFLECIEVSKKMERKRNADDTVKRFQTPNNKCEVCYVDYWGTSGSKVFTKEEVESDKKLLNRVVGNA